MILNYSLKIAKNPGWYFVFALIVNGIVKVNTLKRFKANNQNK
jgi:hypothetical protein